MKPTDLIDHPEGGRFKEVFRSNQAVTNQEGSIRSAATHIYFSLNQGEVSRVHKVAADEIWNLYQGEGLYLYVWDGSQNAPEQIILSAEQNNYCHVVPANYWQAAIPISGKVLVGFTVAPGFEYVDFELIDPESEQGKLLISLSSKLLKFICPS